MTARERILATAQVRERQVDVAGTRTSILDAGAGPPLVLVHGGIEVGGAVWAPVIAALATTHRVIVPDVPGLGESEPLPELDSASFGRWLESVLDLTCEQAPIVVAHSTVGTLAARFAADRSDRLRRLVIYSAPGIGPYRMPLRLRAMAVRFAVRTTARNAERFERFALWDLDGLRRRDPGWFDAFATYHLACARVPHVKRTMMRVVKLGTTRVPDAELAGIDCPVSVIWGRGDRMVPLGVGEGACARLGWRLDVIDEAAHVPHVDQPEAFLARLGEVIADRSGTEPAGEAVA